MAGEKDDIERYHNGAMSSAERHAMEKKALSDPFLADALEGATSISSEVFSADLQELSKKIRQPARVWFTPLRIAAGIILLVGAGTTLYFLNSILPGELALSHAAQSPITADSLTVPLDSTSTLLTLAKPLEPSGDTKKSVASSSTGQAKADQSVLADKTNSGGGVIAEIQETQSQPTVLSTQEEEKSKITSIEISDDKEKVDDLALAASGAAGLDRKEIQTLSAAKMTPAQMSNQKYRNITGKVTSAEDGTALPGVDVVVKSTNEGTITDAQGNYQINTKVANPQFVFSFIGLQTIEASPQQSTLNVQLKEDVSKLSDVVVTRKTSEGNPLNDVDREQVFKMGIPVGGLNAYYKYLENSLRYPAEALTKKIKGKVTIQFTITPNGSLTAFSVLNGLDHACEDEVIRLVKEGPLWIPSKQNDVPFESEVKVMMRFDPEKGKR